MSKKSLKKLKPGSVFVSLVLHEVLLARLKEIANHYKISQSAMIRQLINEYYDKFQRNLYGYQSGQSPRAQVKRQRIDSVFEKIRTGSDEEVTELLLAIGYIQPKFENPGVSHVWNEFKVINGKLTRFISRDWEANGKPDEQALFDTPEQLIDDIKNEIKKGRIKI